MVKFPKNFTILDKINYLQKKIIICSVAYYEYDNPFRSDYDYDNMSHELVKLQTNYRGDLIKDTRFGYVYHDFEGSTGFDLFSHLNDIDKKYIQDFTQMILSKTFYPVLDPYYNKKSKKKNKLF